MGFSLNQFIVASLLVLMGGVTYYAAPLSFVYENFELFFFVVNFILIMMILGLAFVSILLLPLVEMGFLKIFLLFAKADRKLL
jgi:hypothetical protein